MVQEVCKQTSAPCFLRLLPHSQLAEHKRLIAVLPRPCGGHFLVGLHCSAAHNNRSVRQARDRKLIGRTTHTDTPELGREQKKRNAAHDRASRPCYHGSGAFPCSRYRKPKSQPQLKAVESAGGSAQEKRGRGVATNFVVETRAIERGFRGNKKPRLGVDRLETHRGDQIGLNARRPKQRRFHFATLHGENI